MSKTLSAIYKDHRAAQNVVSKLESAGYRRSDISLLVSENGVTTDNISLKETTKAPEGAAIGGVTGTAAGAILGGLTAVGTITATGGIGLLAAGPLVGALTGAGVGGPIGGLVGSLIGYGMPETEAKYVDEYIGKGNVMLGITYDDAKEEQELKKIFESSQPEKVTVH